MRSNIEDLRTKNCFGCAVCAKACPKHIIKTRINEFGFFEPYLISNDKCSKCGLCLDVCAFHNQGLSQKTDFLKSFAGYSNNKEIREMCSSGGVAFELAKAALSQGYKVCTVRYNNQQHIAEHYIAENIDDLKESIGSKYIQSDTLIGMSNINIKNKYIIFGTPCHIDSFRRYTQKINKDDNFILVDFFCHGVPSYLLYQKYLNEKIADIGAIKSVRWRDKTQGWHDSWVMDIKGEHGGVRSKLSEGDLFFRTFLSDSCLGKACYDNCKYKNRSSSADIRLGDAWGQLYQKDNLGVSAVVCFTKKGYDLLTNSDCTLSRHDFDDVAEYQMKRNPQRPIIAKYVWKMLKTDKPLNEIKLNRLLFIDRLLNVPQKIIKRLKKMMAL